MAHSIHVPSYVDVGACLSDIAVLAGNLNVTYKYILYMAFN